MKERRKQVLPLILICVLGLAATLTADLWWPSGNEDTPPSRTQTPETQAPPAPQRLTAEEAHEHLFYEDSERVLLDVRTEDEFREGHILGARLIPLAELQARAPTELLDKDVPIFIYCRSGRRSAEAAALLTELGYFVFDIGGIDDWPFDIVVPE